jgi:hypothetical protein
MPPTDGVILYHNEHETTPPLEHDLLAPLMAWRDRCRAAGLIGVDDDGIGYGNISVRAAEGFIISGTQSGAIERLGPEGYALVRDVEIERSVVRTSGPIAPSSEALTHAMFYRVDATIGAVIHFHHHSLWERLKREAPTSADGVGYGTPAMAAEVARLWRESDLTRRRVMAMAGHDGGAIVIGGDLDEAGARALALIDGCDRIG